MTTLPRARVGDHLAVLGLLVVTLLGVVPFLLHLLLAPFVTPGARRRFSARLRASPPAPAEPPPPDPSAWAGRTVFVVAGEPSGDRLAARVVSALRARAPGLVVRGYGGPALAAAGARLDRAIVEHAVVGFVAVAASLPYWWRLCATTRALLREDPPDLLLTVDFPGLNLRLGRWARRAGVRTVHLVAPQTWAWAPWRSARLRRAVDRLLVVFPFEQAWFADAGLDTLYVGHPLFPPAEPGAAHDAPPSAPPVVELRPGSRRREVARQGRLVLEAARVVAARRPGTRFLLRLASERAREALRGPQPEGVTVHVGPGDPLGPPTVALTTSGTSTTELAVAGVPMVVFYRLPWPMRLLRPALLLSPHFAMVNVLAGERVVEERLVGGSGGAALGEAVAALLSDPARLGATRDALARVRARVVHPGVPDRIARAALGDGPRVAPVTPSSGR